MIAYDNVTLSLPYNFLHFLGGGGMTNGQTHGRTEAWTDGLNPKYVIRLDIMYHIYRL